MRVSLGLKALSDPICMESDGCGPSRREFSSQEEDSALAVHHELETEAGGRTSWSRALAV